MIWNDIQSAARSPTGAGCGLCEIPRFSVHSSLRSVFPEANCNTGEGPSSKDVVANKRFMCITLLLNLHGSGEAGSPNNSSKHAFRVGAASLRY